jgi:hypothetical protein
MKAIVVKVFVLVGLFMFVGMIARAQNPEKQIVVNIYKAQPLQPTKSVDANPKAEVKPEKKTAIRNAYEQPMHLERKVAPLENK